MTLEAVEMTWEISRGTEAICAARGLVTAALAGHPDATVADATLLTSELVTNVMMHTPDDCTLDVSFDPRTDGLMVAVTDRSPGLSVWVAPGAADAAGGYGMRLVSRIASRWGATHGGQTKTVWFRFDGR